MQVDAEIKIYALKLCSIYVWADIFPVLWRKIFLSNFHEKTFSLVTH